MWGGKFLTKGHLAQLVVVLYYYLLPPGLNHLLYDEVFKTTKKWWVINPPYQVHKLFLSLEDSVYFYTSFLLRSRTKVVGKHETTQKEMITIIIKQFKNDICPLFSWNN